MGLPTCVLSEDDVTIIWESASDVNELSEAFGVSLETIVKIKNGLLYTNVTKNLINGGVTLTRGRASQLTHEQAVAVITSDLPVSVLARKYRVSRGVIYDLRSGKTWKHLAYLPRTKSKRLRVSPTRQVKDDWIQFTDAQVLEIVNQFPTMSNAELAKKYNVTSGTISSIRSGKHYKNVTQGKQYPPSKRINNRNHSNTKFDDEDIYAIRNADPSISNGELGRKYGVCSATIWKIKNRVNWKHLK